jgi:hypothetical protein
VEFSRQLLMVLFEVPTWLSRFYLKFLLDCSWFYVKLLMIYFLCVQLVALIEAFCFYYSYVACALVLAALLLCMNLFLLHVCCALVLTTLLLCAHLFLLCSCCAFVANLFLLHLNCTCTYFYCVVPQVLTLLHLYAKLFFNFWSLCVATMCCSLVHDPLTLLHYVTP